MAGEPPRRAGLIAWVRRSIAAGARRSTGRLADAARRPHHLVVAGLAAGLAASPAPVWGAVTIAVVAAAVAGGAARSAGARGLPMIALAGGAVAAGALLGAIRLEAIDTAARRGGPDGAVVSGTAILLEHPRPSQFGSSTAIRMTQGRATGAMLLARVDGPRPWPGGGEPGTILRVAGTARTPAAGGSFDWRAYLRRRGIAFELAIDSIAGTGRRRGGLAGGIDSMRRRAEAAVG